MHETPDELEERLVEAREASGQARQEADRLELVALKKRLGELEGQVQEGRMREEEKDREVCGDGRGRRQLLPCLGPTYYFCLQAPQSVIAAPFPAPKFNLSPTNLHLLSHHSPSLPSPQQLQQLSSETSSLLAQLHEANLHASRLESDLRLARRTLADLQPSTRLSRLESNGTPSHDGDGDGLSSEAAIGTPASSLTELLTLEPLSAHDPTLARRLVAAIRHEKLADLGKGGSGCTAFPSS